MVALHLARKPGGVMAVLRALVFGAVMAGCLASSVYAQDKKEDPNPLKADEEQRRKDGEAIDKQYKATLQRTRKDATETHASDPWSNMRGGDDAKTKR
jgi:hypothetical protein